MQVVPSAGQNLCNRRRMEAKFATNASGVIWWPNLALMPVAPSGSQIWINASGATISWRDNSSFRCYTLGNQHWFQFWPPCCDIYFSYKFGHQMAPLALFANLATRWHHLHNCKYGHQIAPLTIIANLATRWHHLHYLQI